MAIISLTNDPLKHELMIRYHIDAGFLEHVEMECGGMHLSVHGKLRGGGPNVLVKDGEITAGIGTFLIDGQEGSHALPFIASSIEDLDSLREGMLGNYAIFRMNDLGGRLFIDKNGCYKLYYWSKGQEWVISNSLAGLSLCVPDLTIDEISFVEHCYNYAILGADTIFHEVRSLMGDEVLEFTPHGISVRAVMLPSSAKDVVSNLTDHFVKELVKVTTQIWKAYGPGIGVHMTGGLDSRLVLSSMLAARISPTLVYTQGNSPLVDTKTPDLDIDKKISDLFKLKLEVMSLETNLDALADHWVDCYRKYGFFLKMDGVTGPENPYRSGVAGSLSFLESGFFGERLRIHPWIADRLTDEIDFDDYLDGVYINPVVSKVFEGYEEYREKVKKKTFELAARSGVIIRNGRFIRDDFQRINDLYRRNSDTVMMNYQNLFTHSFIILSSPTLFEAAYFIPESLKKDAKFMLGVIRRLCPDLLDIPFYSHNSKQTYHRLLGTIKPTIGIESVMGVYRKLNIASHPRLVRLANSVFRIPSVQNFMLGDKGSNELNSVDSVRSTILEIIKKNDHPFSTRIRPENFDSSYVIGMANHACCSVGISSSHLLRAQLK